MKLWLKRLGLVVLGVLVWAGLDTRGRFFYAS